VVERRHSNLAIVAKSLDIQAAEAIREQILSGGFPPGSRLLEIPLSEQLNLSRGTIRSALQQLTYEGLVVQIPYKGCAVLELSSQDAWELYTLRSALEGLAAKLAAAAMTADKAEILNSSLKQLIEATKSDRRGKVADADFGLQQQYQIVGQQIRLYIASCNTLIPDVEEIIEQHRLLIEAICSGNTAIAERIAKEHNADGEELIKHLEKVEIKNF
jgi:DNA-binding GntR family transcriptional regulator